MTTLKFVQLSFGIKRATAGILAFEVHTLVDRHGKTVGYEGQVKSKQRGTLIERIPYPTQAHAFAGLAGRAVLLHPKLARRILHQKSATL